MVPRVVRGVGEPVASPARPDHCGARSEALDSLVSLLRGRRCVALTGAGCSTESGIPDYRGLGSRGRPRASIEGPDFRRSPSVRQRYWARATLGWGILATASPNDGHRALAQLEAAGIVSGVITQNVDRLHHRAGSGRVVELHGALADVRCLACRTLHPRDEIHERLVAANAAWLAARVAEGGVASAEPDGDSELSDAGLADFAVVDCSRCGGVLQPNVVFFGDAVAREIVDSAFALLEDAEVLLVAGTSLTVFSGYRFLLRAAERGRPIAIVNLGRVRGEERAAVKVEERTGKVLPAILAALA